MQKDPDRFLEYMARSVLQEVTVAGRVVRRGSTVRIKTLPGADLLDATLAGRIAIVEGIDEDDAGSIHISVTLPDDPGWDLQTARHPAHRFFFAPGELEPVAEDAPVRRRVLVAGIGNVFLGDDGFGVAVVLNLLERPLPPGVEVGDFGIRGTDLAYALGSGYDAAILVDALPRGSAPGTLHVVEPDEAAGAVPPDSHQMHPVAVLQLARQLGPLPARLLFVGCEPEHIPADSRELWWMSLSPAVAAAVAPAATMVVQLAASLAATGSTQPFPAT